MIVGDGPGQAVRNHKLQEATRAQIGHDDLVVESRDNVIAKESQAERNVLRVKVENSIPLRLHVRHLFHKAQYELNTSDRW